MHGVLRPSLTWSSTPSTCPTLPATRPTESYQWRTHHRTTFPYSLQDRKLVQLALGSCMHGSTASRLQWAINFTAPSTQHICTHHTLHPISPLLLSPRYGPGCNTLFDYKISMLVCGGNGPSGSKSIIKKFLEYRKGAACACGWVPPYKYYSRLVLRNVFCI